MFHDCIGNVYDVTDFLDGECYGCHVLSTPGCLTCLRPPWYVWIHRSISFFDPINEPGQVEAKSF